MQTTLRNYIPLFLLYPPLSDVSPAFDKVDPQWLVKIILDWSIDALSQLLSLTSHHQRFKEESSYVLVEPSVTGLDSANVTLFCHGTSKFIPMKERYTYITSTPHTNNLWNLNSNPVRTPTSSEEFPHITDQLIWSLPSRKMSTIFMHLPKFEITQHACPVLIGQWDVVVRYLSEHQRDPLEIRIRQKGLWQRRFVHNLYHLFLCKFEVPRWRLTPSKSWPSLGKERRAIPM